MLQKTAVEKKTLELLVKLMNDEMLNDRHLVGGTALALYMGHRKSVDLDLLSDVFMVLDHAAALDFVLDRAKEKTEITLKFIQDINTLVLKSTGKIYHTPFGEIDSSKVQFRKGAVFAGNSYFPSFDKVEKMTDNLVDTINHRMKEKLSIDEQLYLSFDAHFRLVSIHPFYDGNGRTARLLMNYLQAYYNLPLTFVDSSYRQEYFQTLIDTREKDDLNIFRSFMESQYSNYLSSEIEKFNNQNKI